MCEVIKPSFLNKSIKNLSSNKWGESENVIYKPFLINSQMLTHIIETNMTMSETTSLDDTGL